MVDRVLVAVEDTPAAMRAARMAVDLARRTGASMRVVTVLRDGVLTAALTRSSTAPQVEERQQAALASVLGHVRGMAAAEGVPAQTCERLGEPGPEILAEARSWDADLIVVGRAARRGPAEAYADAVSAHVLELADVPVLVVP